MGSASSCYVPEVKESGDVPRMPTSALTTRETFNDTSDEIDMMKNVEVIAYLASSSDEEEEDDDYDVESSNITSLIQREEMRRTGEFLIGWEVSNISESFYFIFSILCILYCRLWLMAWVVVMSHHSLA
jgi:hypothetical protein